jgi:cytochrome c-type biogenesis protein CcmH
MRSKLAVQVVLTAVLLALGVSAAWVGAAVKATVQEVAEGLTCQCGCGLTVANCNHPNCGFSVPVRDQIAHMLDKGMSGAEILASFRHKYGEKVLSEPVPRGFNLLAWIMPFAAIAAGGVLIMVAAGRWHHAPEDGPVPTDPAGGHEAYNADIRERLERELRREL